MKKLLYTFVVIVLIIAGAYAASRYWGKSEVRSKGTTVAEGEYITHISKEFSFEYPKGWYLYDGTDAVIFPRIGITNYDPDVYVESPHATGNFFKFELVKHNNVRGLSLREWIDDYLATAALNDAQSDVLTTSDATIDDMPAIKLTARVRGMTYEAVYTQRSGSVYVFTFGGPISEEFRPVFEHILETFTFNANHAKE